jgi:hypothetical protein
VGVYEKHFTIAALATTVVGAQILPASGKECEILEIGLWNTTAVLSEIGLVRQTTAGVTPTTSASTLFQPLDPARVASGTNLVTAWGTAPTTVTPQPLRVFELAASIGAGIVFPWASNELWSVNSTTGGLLLYNLGAATSAALRGYIKIRE